MYALDGLFIFVYRLIYSQKSVLYSFGVLADCGTWVFFVWFFTELIREKKQTQR